MLGKNNPLDEQEFQQLDEDTKMKILMSHFAELEGKIFEEINEELRKDPVYLPSKESQQAFEKWLDRQFQNIRKK